MKKIHVFFFLCLFAIPMFGAVGDRFDVDSLRYEVFKEGINNHVFLQKNLDVNRTIVYIPDSVTNPSNGKSYCVKHIFSDGLWSSTQLDSIRLPNRLDSILPFNFRYTALKSIYIPASVRTIGVDAFYECDSLRRIVVDSGNAHFTSIDGVLFTKDKKGLHSYPYMKDSVYRIPDGVEWIGENAFASRFNVTDVVVPSSLRKIFYSAFGECINLRTIDLEHTSLDSIDVGAFGYCISLEQVVFPPTLRFIDMDAFSQCYALKKVNFLKITSPLRIKNDAFYLCKSLDSLIFPSTIESIYNSAFNNCYKLVNIDFRNVSKYVYISSNFNNCISLNSIYCNNPIPHVLHPSSFINVDKVACDVFVPDSILPAYMAAPVWRDFFISNLVVEPNDSLWGNTQGGGVFKFFEQDTLVATAKPGYAFVYWKNKHDSILSYNDTLIYTMKYNDSVTAYFRDLSLGDATLINITPSAGTLLPQFDNQQFNYTDTVPYAVDSIRFSVVTSSPRAMVNGVDTLMQPLSVGHNACTVTVTSEDGYVTQTYHIDVYRLNNNAYLHDLQLQGYGVTPAFDSLTYLYQATVPAMQSSATLLPTLSDPKGEVVGSLNNRPLSIGSNRFDILVRAEDRDTTRTYTLVVEREKYPPVEETRVLQVNVNGTDLLSSPVYSFNGLYSGGCGEGEFTITITPADQGVLNIATPLTVTIDALAGYDTVYFEVASEDGSMVSTHQLILEKRFDFDQVVETMWNENSFMLDIRMLNAHGIAVDYDSPYRWYKSGNPIMGGDLPTLSAGPNATDKFEYGVPYYLEMITADSVTLRTCEKILTEPSATVQGVYPNPVAVNHPFSFSLEQADGFIEVYAMNGAFVKRLAVESKQVTLSLSEQGVYLLKHVVSGELLRWFKVVVK